MLSRPKAIKAVGKKRAKRMTEEACEGIGGSRHRKTENIEIIASRAGPRKWSLKGY